MDSVAAFTDTYLPTVNGVTYTVKTWRDRWQDRGGRMDVVYPKSDGYTSERREYPVRSVPFPFYQGFRLALPTVPDEITEIDLVHAHTPFALGLAARRLAQNRDLPFVTSYHTPTDEYAAYVAGQTPMRRPVRSVAKRYERWFFEAADAVIVPTETTKDRLRVATNGETSIYTIGNGVDTDRFRPVDDTQFREKHDLGDGSLVGYTGRHGYEKQLDELLAAVDGLDRESTLVVAGDGPARDELEAEARQRGLDARFLGFLDREELPTFYSALDAFLFPSPIETQGLVALEANACGTPVVGVDSGALTETVVEGETGYRYPQGDLEAFRRAIDRTLAETETLRETCLDRREEICVARAIDNLETVYDEVR